MSSKACFQPPPIPCLFPHPTALIQFKKKTTGFESQRYDLLVKQNPADNYPFFFCASSPLACWVNVFPTWVQVKKPFNADPGPLLLHLWSSALQEGEVTVCESWWWGTMGAQHPRRVRAAAFSLPGAPQFSREDVLKEPNEINHRILALVLRTRL